MTQFGLACTESLALFTFSILCLGVKLFNLFSTMMLKGETSVLVQLIPVKYI